MKPETALRIAIAFGLVALIVNAVSVAQGATPSLSALFCVISLISVLVIYRMQRESGEPQS